MGSDIEQIKNRYGIDICRTDIEHIYNTYCTDKKQIWNKYRTLEWREGGGGTQYLILYSWYLNVDK